MWEYMTTHLQADLNAHGANGWELAAVHDGILFFKRLLGKEAEANPPPPPPPEDPPAPPPVDVPSEDAPPAPAASDAAPEQTDASNV